jgi:hypothetical protein
MKSKILKIIGKGILWTIGVIAGLYILLIIIRIPHVIKVNHTNIQIDKIHATKLTLADVMGDNLPPNPGIEADKTIAGIDANKNSIRDDVELAIFKEYPKSAKIRAVLLQYALVMQMETTLAIMNTETVTELVREEDRADICLADTVMPRKTPESSRTNEEVKKIDTYIDFLKKIQINNIERKNAQDNFYTHLGSYSSLDNSCDIDFTLLPN